MKRKFIIVSLLVLAGLMGALPLSMARAEAPFPSVKGLEPFTPPANFMSLPGYLRWDYFLQSGRWLARAEAEKAVESQGVSIGRRSMTWRHRTDRPSSVLPLTASLQEGMSLQRGF